MFPPWLVGGGGLTSSSTDFLDGTLVPALHCGKARVSMCDSSDWRSKRSRLLIETTPI